MSITLQCPQPDGIMSVLLSNNNARKYDMVSVRKSRLSCREYGRPDQETRCKGFVSCLGIIPGPQITWKMHVTKIKGATKSIGATLKQLQVLHWQQ